MSIKSAETEPGAARRRTLVGWQGIRFALPPDWNVTGFSMDRDNGYLRVDAPNNSAVTVQIRWRDAARPDEGPSNLYSLIAPTVRNWLRRPPPPVKRPDLKANLERMFKETAKQAKKAKATFESTIRAERKEGAKLERSAMSFSWTGAGRGQGKIWYCDACHRIVIAQVVGLAKDQAVIASIASQLFATLHDHADDGYDLWALYDLQVEVPSDFRLHEQKLLAGYLRLSFNRRGERLIVDRWGLANITRKKFELDEWLQNNAAVGIRGMARDEVGMPEGHTVLHFRGRTPPLALLKILRETIGGVRRFASQYEAGIWECPQENKIFALQVMRAKRSETLWKDVLDRVLCHGAVSGAQEQDTAREKSQRDAVG